MNKILKRLFAGTLLTVFVTISGVVTIILFPEPLFAHKLKYKQFNVYSNDNIDQGISPILDNSLGLIEASELYDPNYTFDIFLSHNSIFNKIDDAVIGFGPSARATDNNVIIKVAVNLKTDKFYPTFYQQCEGKLTYLISHELVHALQENRYGKLKFNPFRHPELWKLEGYPEYVSRRTKRLRSNYDLAAEIDRYIALKNKSTDIWMEIEQGGCKVPDYYFKSRLMTEYLMDIKRISYDDILADTTGEQLIYAEMVRWKDAKK